LLHKQTCSTSLKEAYMAQHPAHSQDHRHPGQPSPVAVQKALAGVDYPTTREHLAETARAHHADREIVDLLGKLPDKNYDSPAAVSKAIAQVQ
jgi:hypothetical protein